VEIFDASVVFCGDLVWSGMFPNYVDARPGRLSRAVRVLGARRAHVYVSGHGVVVDGAGLERYLRLLDHVERYAREAMDRGRTPAEAGATYRLPDELADWTLFNPQYFERAIAAWFREIQG